jgi:hypothetical protein
LPLEYEANIASFKEIVEATPPTSFDDLIPFDELECLEFEVQPYTQFQVPPMSNFFPVEQTKLNRPGCEFEFNIRGSRGDPDLIEKKPEEKVVAMPGSCLKPFDQSTDRLINPHPTLREYKEYKSHTEIDPEFDIYPYERERAELTDEIMLRGDRFNFGSMQTTMFNQLNLTYKTDINISSQDMPGNAGIKSILPMPMDLSKIYKHR